MGMRSVKDTSGGRSWKNNSEKKGQKFQCAPPLLLPVCNQCVVMKRKNQTKISIKVDAWIRPKIIGHGAILIDWGCRQILPKTHYMFSFSMSYAFLKEGNVKKWAQINSGFACTNIHDLKLWGIAVCNCSQFAKNWEVATWPTCTKTDPAYQN